MSSPSKPRGELTSPAEPTGIHRQRALAPVFRKLRVFGLDPSFTGRLESASLIEMTIWLRWEELAPGPVGQYIAVFDVDESGKQLHASVDLDRPDLLAQDGLAASDGNPQFRQQMVYAIAMRTIANFERALGRVVHWPPMPAASHPGRASAIPAYREQLNLYPHYMAELNAYWYQDKGLCFGYSAAHAGSPLPGTCVFTCLSPDVIAHELVHAIMAGMNIEFMGANVDLHAFHEAFADLVALFQHFWHLDLLRAELAANRGSLDERSPLGMLATQLGEAMGMADGLRSALGFTDKDGKWQPRQPDPALYQNKAEPHARGVILVAAVFQAFRKIYNSRIADLRRIATKGTGIHPQGSLHPDLIERFTKEATKCARQVLDMCVRALDYMPPVEITFGDYLRAIVTADHDLDPEDRLRYRVAFVDAFRSYGIAPGDVGTLSLESLLWPRPTNDQEASVLAGFVRGLARKHTSWHLPRYRKDTWIFLEEKKRELASFLKKIGARTIRRLGGIDLQKPFEVCSILPRERTGLAGDRSFQWVIRLVQRLGRSASAAEPLTGNDRFRGCTLLVDADTGIVRYQIEKAAARAKRRRPEAATDLLRRTATAVSTPPTERRLRVFALDPTLGTQLETAVINEVTLRVPWERDQHGNDLLEPGPVGEYLEVVDRDPASGCYYAPVNLNATEILAQDGLPPSEANPQFHQQMVYAVAMRTIRTFERALGRVALWSPRRIRLKGKTGERKWLERYVRRLRIYPHALREANAYYSPDKKAVLFGYFPAPADEGAAHAARLTVFTCLSHDIVAHEVTHALLDGMHRRFNEASNPDVLAFHEAFADIVALFLHFSLPEVLRHQIAKTRGDLESQSSLGELAQQVGQAIGKRGALRSAIGEIDETTKEWRVSKPDPEQYRTVMEPHDRGALLVAAVFDAFLTIYKTRVADLLRIATEGTGVLPAGHLHPDLVNRLADEAADSARRVLDMCIRALDYCPPVDLTFGDYLRAIVTADYELDPVDDGHRRVAFVEAFRRHGIVPEDVRTLSVDGLRWRDAIAAPDLDEKIILDGVKGWAADIASWRLSRSREELWKLMKKKRAALHEYLKKKLIKESAVLSGIDRSLPFEVHSIRPSMRTDWEGRPYYQWVIELTQRIGQFLNPEDDKEGAVPDYYFRGGCTLLVDAETGEVRFSINKRLDAARKERQRRFVVEEGNLSLAATYFGGVADDTNEPFAMLHRF